MQFTIYFWHILCLNSVWSEDTWLQEHAGETIQEKADREDEKGTKRSAVSETVS